MMMLIMMMFVEGEKPSHHAKSNGNCRVYESKSGIQFWATFHHHRWQKTVSTVIEHQQPPLHTLPRRFGLKAWRNENMLMRMIQMKMATVRQSCARLISPHRSAKRRQIRQSFTFNPYQTSCYCAFCHFCQ